MTMFFFAAVTFGVMVPLALIIKNNPADKGYGPDGQSPDGGLPVDPSALNGGNALGSQTKVKDVKDISEALKDGSFWFLSISHFFCGSGCGIMMTHIVVFPIDIGYSDMVGASLVSAQGFFNLVGLLVTGPLSDKIPRRNVLALCHFFRSLSFVMIVMFIFLGGGPLWLLYVSMALFGFGLFTTAPLAAGLVVDLFGSSRMGTILGMVTSCHILGMAIGAYAGGVIFDSTGSYELVFLIQGPLEFLAAIFALFVKQKSLQ
jgi:MFS family permease